MSDTNTLPEQFERLPEDMQWRLFVVLDAVIGMSQDEKDEVLDLLYVLAFTPEVTDSEPMNKLVKALKTLVSGARRCSESTG